MLSINWHGTVVPHPCSPTHSAIDPFSAYRLPSFEEARESASAVLPGQVIGRLSIKVGTPRVCSELPGRPGRHNAHHQTLGPHITALYAAHTGASLRERLLTRLDQLRRDLQRPPPGR
jgi:hypothetical protein